MKAKKRHSIVQTHHISYNPEVKVKVFKGEHYILTLIQRRRKFSKGFVQGLESEIPRIEEVSVNLEAEEE
jgi:hypothetical protein